MKFSYLTNAGQSKSSEKFEQVSQHQLDEISWFNDVYSDMFSLEFDNLFSTIDFEIFESKENDSATEIKVPITSIFLLSRLILHNTESTFSKKFFELHETQFFYNVLKTFKFAAILVHHSHQSSSVLSQL